jgi:cytosine/adenosine deaminase-related metal-dependent hydrolase
MLPVAQGPSTTIRVGRVLTEPGHAVSLGATAIHIADGKVVTLEPVDPASLTRQERGLLLLPALANAHDHGRGLRTIAAGAPDGRLEEWAVGLACHPKVDSYLVAAIAFARLAESGVAAVNHCHNPQDSEFLLAEAEAVSRAARDTGVRVAFALPFADRNPYVYGDLGELLDRLPPEDRPAIAATRQRSRAINLELFEKIAELEHDCFTLQYGPVAPQWTRDDTLEEIARASAENGRRVHMHLFETRRQREWADAAYPDGLIRHLDNMGFLTPRLTVAHAVWLHPDECRLMAERGVTVSINVSSNLRLRSGLPRFEMIRDARLGFGVGLDGMSLDDDEDILREIRLLRLLHDGIGDHQPFAAAELFDAACIAGRRTITGDDGGGRIVSGAPADLLALDFAEMSRDIVRDDVDIPALVLARAARRHVKLLFVNGKEIVRDGRCVTVDLPGLEAELHVSARAALAKTDPDPARIARIQHGIADFFACGCHRTGRR